VADDDLELDLPDPDLDEALRAPVEPPEDFAVELRREELTDPYAGGPRSAPPILITMTAMGPAADARARRLFEDLALLAQPRAPTPGLFAIHGHRQATDVAAGLHGLGLHVLADAFETTKGKP